MAIIHFALHLQRKSLLSPCSHLGSYPIGESSERSKTLFDVKLAKEAGYDGVEIMGSEGYLINQFIAKRTNKRTDSCGGLYENRIRFPLEVVKSVREANW